MCVYQSYDTSRSVLLISCSKFCMYLHWPSVRGRAVRLSISMDSWTLSISPCTTNTGPGQERRDTLQVRLNMKHNNLCIHGQPYGWVGCLVTHVSTWSSSYIQTNTSTPLPHWPVCSALARNCPSTCTTANDHHFTVSVSVVFDSSSVFSAFTLSHLAAITAASRGRQILASGHPLRLYGLNLYMSRNHAESTRPLTCTPPCPCDSKCSAMLSTFTRTPMPPALMTERVEPEFKKKFYQSYSLNIR